MLVILQPGNFTSLQDLGRWKMHEYGVPLSGAMDRNSAILANMLLNNSIEAPVLEFILVGPKIQWKQSGMAALTGGRFNVHSNQTGLVPWNMAVHFEENEIWNFGPVKEGLRGYLAVKGGFLGTSSLGSCSMSMGVTEQVVFKKNDLISFGNTPEVKTERYAQIKATPLDEKKIYGYKGPEWHLWEQTGLDLFQKEWRLSKDHNRMGIRLMPFSPRHNHSILTSPVLPGTVQWTPAGQLIVLMREGQTTGGYPRIFQLTESSINILAQKNTDEKFYFVDHPLNFKT
ncbi:MAG: hypothetical protein RLZZ248_1432 [Bacteroidota bacterium]